MYVLLPLLVVAPAAALGALPAAARTGMPWLQGLAVVSALGAVLFVTLPSAVAELGLAALALAALGLLVPLGVERALHQHTSGATWALGVLALHQVVDGAQIAWMGPTLGVALALGVAAHGAPMVAAGVLAASADGPAATSRAAAVLVGATLGGGLLGQFILGDALHAVEPWVRAAVSGLLLHALLHLVGARAPTPVSAP